MTPTVDMFNGTKPRKAARVMAHMEDCGADVACFKCSKCGWESDWLVVETITEVKRGVPCEKCNEVNDNDR